MKFTWISFLMLLTYSLSAQLVDKIEPPFWWSGMQNDKLQILLHGNGLAKYDISIASKEAKLINLYEADSPNYVFLDVVIPHQMKASSFEIVIKDNTDFYETYTYQVKSRTMKPENRVGFDNSDVMYLITPDRFANGDTANDEVVGLQEGLDRIDHFGRHGGDIKGIRDNLDYIKDLGFTAIWLNPILENDVAKASYHGYSTTDYYKVDPRYGSNADYVELIAEAKSKGIKVIMDMIANHCGIDHWWMEDPPFKNWINGQDQPYTQTNHRKATLLDPHAAAADRVEMEDGWFVPTMPDLNQRNPFMATYLIQNSIWWVEYSDIAGIRQDTYSYPNADFMGEWTCAIMNEYPNLNIVGEEWVLDQNMIGFWQDDNPNSYQSCLPSLMDFPLTFSLVDALKEEEGWGTGLIRLYENLAKDYIYADADAMVIFPDNHDMSRIYTNVNEDFELYKMAIGFIATMRGVPQFYYGTEVLLSHPGTDSHGEIREDFPGGWEGDTANGFTNQNLSDQAIAAKAYMKSLLQWRKDKSVIHSGRLMHYVPRDGVYVYFRYNASETVMVIINKQDEAVELDLSRFSERLDGYTKGKDCITSQFVDLSSNLLTADGKSITIYELEK